MAEGDATVSASTSSNREGSSLCEECKSNPSKYKCPACSLRSCSLNCVKAHKRHSGCTGKRKHIQLVPLSQFNDSILLSDYNLLEEVKRMAESAQRFRKKLCPYTHAYFRLPFHLKSLRTAALSRRTKIMFLPTGMTKRENNQTRYDETIDHHVNILYIDSHFTVLNLQGATSPFRELDSRLPIRQLFYNLVFVEYPVIYVVLPSQTPNFQVVKTANPMSHNPEDTNTGKNDLASHEGVSFRVEEIEDDDNSCNPQVLDLLKVSTSSPHGATLGNHEFGNGPNSSSQAEELAVSKGLEFDFEQDLIDTYSNIMAQINPDDFLDWEGDFSKGVEELEEGEIME
ncbi:Box C/D snoRNA protein 1, partial [Cucurbita argyrosperma subsp. argyrosperma]